MSKIEKAGGDNVGYKRMCGVRKIDSTTTTIWKRGEQPRLPVTTIITHGPDSKQLDQ